MFFILAAAILAACQSGPSPDNSPNGASAGETESAKAYFPVLDFLKGEISMVDSLPVGILKYVTIGEKTDSQYIKPEAFHELANEFLAPELQRARFENEFTETSFYDKSVHSSTFLYTAKSDDLPLRRVDILSESGGAYDKIKSVYMEKLMARGDTAITRKMYWKPQRHFQINTLSSVGGAAPDVVLIKVAWDNRD